MNQKTESMNKIDDKKVDHKANNLVFQNFLDQQNYLNKTNN